jgi:CDP-glucose 4,6-dehydratase
LGNLVDRYELEIFRGKKVLVTGDTGFKGSWLALWLEMLGADVMGISLPPAYEKNHYDLINLKNKIRHVDCDIRNYEELKKTVGDFKPEFFFHLAAQALVLDSYENPRTTYETNVIGSVNVLEVVRSVSSVRSLIYVTSDKCYKNKEWLWGYRENDELGGHDPYSSSKACAELVFDSYLKSFFDKGQIGIASVRAGNVIGGGDWSDNRIIPDFIRALQEGREIFLRNPDATRPWQHVLEPLSGYLFLASNLFHEPSRYSGSWNFGPTIDSIKSVKELTGLMIDVWGNGKMTLNNQPNTWHEASLLHLCCDKANHILNWHPKWDFSKCVNETLSWYKKVLIDKANPLEISVGQIREYMEK